MRTMNSVLRWLGKAEKIDTSISPTASGRTVSSPPSDFDSAGSSASSAENPVTSSGKASGSRAVSEEAARGSDCCQSDSSLCAMSCWVAASDTGISSARATETCAMMENIMQKLSNVAMAFLTWNILSVSAPKAAAGHGITPG